MYCIGESILNRGIEIGKAQGLEEGIVKGRKQIEDCLADLVRKMSMVNDKEYLSRMDEWLTDEKALTELCERFGVYFPHASQSSVAVE